MGGLQEFERKLENAISGVFARAFRSAVQPVEIAAALQREADNNTQILSRDRRLVPNDFHVELSPSDLDRLSPYDSTLERELTDQLRDHADQQGYVFPGPVSIGFEQADDLTTGRFRIRSRARASVTGRDTESQVREARAWVEVNGSRHAISSSTVVGRGTEADVRINDPGVSRQHVQFRLRTRRDGAQVTVEDLGSTNGMLVDGHRTTSMELRDGSVVKIGNTAITVHLDEGGRGR